MCRLHPCLFIYLLVIEHAGIFIIRGVFVWQMKVTAVIAKEHTAISNAF